MSVQSQIDRLAGAKTTIGNYLQQNGVAVPSGATLDEMALQLADVIEKQNKITASGILKGDGAGGVSAAKAGTDYATPAQVAAKQDVILASGASVGDLIKVKAVDASGKPTAWAVAVAGTDYLKTAPVTSVNGKTGAVNVSKSDVGLGNVDNVSINTRLNRTTNVNAADANYGAYMARGIMLSPTEQTPTVNGCICLVYE